MVLISPVLCFLLALLLSGTLGNDAVKSRSKRALSSNRRQSTAQSIQELVFQLGKKHLFQVISGKKDDVENPRESVYILQRDSCSKITMIGKPVTHNSNYKVQGAWMKDPLGIMGTETIFVMAGYSGRNVVEEFENMGMFKAGVTRKTYSLPYQWDGTGGVVYGPYLYYNRASTLNIVKYNLRTERLETQMGLSGSARTNNYQWGGYTGVDLAVDEQGLWVLWGANSNSYRLKATKIDVYQNSLIQTWNLNTESMSSMANAFVACGVIYCIDTYNSRSTTINFAYDTKTGQQWNPNIQFTNQYGYNSMVDYNPREKVLYAWDNKYLVTYPITFE